MKTIIEVKARRYDIDWLRIGLIISVFFFHIGMFFNGFGWHIKNNEEIEWLNPIMAYLHRWRMPLLFFVSGVGTYFALGKRSIGQYLKERAKRLLIPLVFGIFLIVPPQVYIEKHTEYASFLQFIPEFTDGIYPEGNFSWHHLWFIVYLFICSAVAIPIIALFKSKYKQKISNGLNSFFKTPGALLSLSIPLFLAQFILQKYFPWETHALINDWAYLTYNFLFFIYGFILFSDNRLIEQITKQRRINLAIASLLSVVFFIDYFYSIDPYVSEGWQLFISSLLEWSIGLAVIGYGSKYLNKENRIRKHLNEAIYPFYILHQTAIVAIGFSLYNQEIGVGAKALMLTSGSLTVSVLIYLILIRPFNFVRVIFGMRTLAKPQHKSLGKELLRKAS